MQRHPALAAGRAARSGLPRPRPAVPGPGAVPPLRRPRSHLRGRRGTAERYPRSASRAAGAAAMPGAVRAARLPSAPSPPQRALRGRAPPPPSSCSRQPALLPASPRRRAERPPRRSALTPSLPPASLGRPRSLPHPEGAHLLLLLLTPAWRPSAPTRRRPGPSLPSARRRASLPLPPAGPPPSSFRGGPLAPGPAIAMGRRGWAARRGQRRLWGSAEGSRPQLGLVYIETRHH